MSLLTKWQTLTPEERNALIAEKVFQRSVNRDRTWGRLLLNREDHPGLTEEIPVYSENMDAAWLIVEKLYTHHDIRLLMENDNTERYYVQVWAHGRDKIVGYGSSHTSMADAICIAALRVADDEYGVVQ